MATGWVPRATYPVSSAGWAARVTHPVTHFPALGLSLGLFSRLSIAPTIPQLLKAWVAACTKYQLAKPIT
jgi:hypothetical protein